jgi:hypothetical protein
VARSPAEHSRRVQWRGIANFSAAGAVKTASELAVCASDGRLSGDSSNQELALFCRGGAKGKCYDIYFMRLIVPSV